MSIILAIHNLRRAFAEQTRVYIADDNKETLRIELSPAAGVALMAELEKTVTWHDNGEGRRAVALDDDGWPIDNWACPLRLTVYGVTVTKRMR